jgi:hypothetical protein
MRTDGLQRAAAPKTGEPPAAGQGLEGRGSGCVPGCTETAAIVLKDR